MIRNVAKLIALLAAIEASEYAGAATLDLSKPEDVIAAEIRLGCAPDPKHPRLSVNQGSVYSHRAGEPDRHLFDVLGLTTRACEVMRDPKRGPGYRAVGREIMFFIDLASRDILESWLNPWTAERVEVLHMLNDPTSMAQPRYAFSAEREPEARWTGTIVEGLAVSRRTQPFFRDNPLGGPYQDFIGGKYHVLESSTDVVPVASWLDTSVPSASRGVSSWTRISPWLPWMKMGDREGLIVITSYWTSVGSLDALPEPLRGRVRADFPQFAEAPPFDDRRPFVYSWISYRQQIDARRAAAPAQPSRVP